MKNEGDVKRKVRAMVRERYPDAWEFMPVQTGYGKTGVPDILYCINGLLVGIETKFGYNKPTPNQRREIAAIDKAGGCAIVVNERDYFEILRDLFTLIDARTDSSGRLTNG